ncbi:MAG: F0F1 ATP synthase subunit A [Bacteroidales bacterium]|nr:F0F1 ATP synthase subunit A [Bacteroidales bacterium]
MINSRHSYYLHLFLALILMSSVPQIASAEEQSPKEIVLGHLADSYEWHMTNIGEKPVTIYLPVIIKTTEGWKCFSSRNILPAGKKYGSLQIAAEGDYKDKVVEILPDGNVKRPFDISITKTALGIMINSAVVLLLVMCAARWYRKRKEIDYAPKGLAGLLEMAVNSLMDSVIKPCVGSNYLKFAPYLLTVFFFIFINNVMGLIPFFPGGANVTGNIAVTFLLAVATFCMVNIFGTKHYWKDIFWPDVPVPLKAIPLMPLIEFVGLFTKPFALMIRLFANITAGHAIVLSLTCVVFVTANMGVAINSTMSAVSVLFTIFMDFLELLVAFIQAYVFTMLSAVFIGLAQTDPEPSNK